MGRIPSARGGWRGARAATAVAVVLLTGALAAGCGSGGAAGGGLGSPSAPPTASRPSADVVVTATPAGAAVQLARAETLQVLPAPQASTAGVSTRYEVQPADSQTLTAAGPAGLFVAAAPGTATVLVSQAPSCPKGQECPAHVVAVGSVRVTVTG